MTESQIDVVQMWLDFANHCIKIQIEQLKIIWSVVCHLQRLCDVLSPVLVI